MKNVEFKIEKLITIEIIGFCKIQSVNHSYTNK